MSSLNLSMVAGAISVGIMFSLALTAVTLNDVAMHSQSVILNLYTNGTSDWSMNATTLLRSAYGLMFITFCLGLALGLLLTCRQRAVAKA